jgi:anaerobic carbon-monoxide dehydrogenase iron sulfur subunit
MKLVLDIAKCTGCKICQLACSAKHEGVFNPKKAHLKIIDGIKKTGRQKELLSCTLCLSCVKSCPVEAIQYGDLHLTVSRNLCIGCGQCVDACSQGLIYLNANQIAAVPDFCRGNPVCIDWCPHNAIHQE